VDTERQQCSLSSRYADEYESVIAHRYPFRALYAELHGVLLAMNVRQNRKMDIVTRYKSIPSCYISQAFAGKRMCYNEKHRYAYRLKCNICALCA